MEGVGSRYEVAVLLPPLFLLELMGHATERCWRSLALHRPQGPPILAEEPMRKNLSVSQSYSMPEKKILALSS